MRRARALLPKLLVLALCLGLLLPTPVSAAELYLTSVNDRVLPLTADTMPLWSGGLLYVPYNVFDSDVSQVDLDIETSYSPSAQTVTFYNTRQRLVFDLKTGTSRDDITGTVYYAKAIIRNGKPYVPLNTVCNFFGLSRSYTAISQGYLVRIKNSSVVLSDSDFIEAASELIERRVREYNQSLNPSTDTTTPSVTPTPTPTPDPDDTETGSTADRRTYLAFLCRDTRGLTDILDALDERGAYGMFFLTPQTLEEAGTLVQRILGTGHSIGLLSQSSDLTSFQGDLDEGNRLLELTAHTRSGVTYAPKSLRASLEEAGWVCWNETSLLKPSDTVGANTFAANTVSRLSGRKGSVYLTMEVSANTARVLPSLLRYLENNHFILSTPLETRL